MSITPAACASCVLGATSTALLSFAYTKIETISVTVNTYIAVFPDGHRSTSFESVTSIATDVIGGAAGNNSDYKTFSNTDHLTWTVGDATLTYPTTYVQYLGFEGAPVETGNGQQCANPTDANALAIPATTDASAFIYPLAAGATGAAALPLPLLEYLGGLEQIAAQFGRQPLTGCSGLDYVPPTAVASSSFLNPTITVPSTSITSPLKSSILVIYPSSSRGNYSFSNTYRSSSSSSLRFQTSTYAQSYQPLSSSTPGYDTSTYAESYVPYSSYLSSYVQGPPSTYTSKPTRTSVVQQTTHLEPTGTVSHQTAYVIQTIQGRTLVTTESNGKLRHSNADWKNRLLTLSTEPAPPYTNTKTHNPQGPATKHSPTQGGPSTPTAEPVHNPPNDNNPPHNDPPDNDPPTNNPVDSNPPNDNPPSNDHPGNDHPGNDQPSNNNPTVIGQPGSDQNQQNPQPAANSGGTHTIFSVGNSQITANPNGDVTIGSTTVHPGQTITIGTGVSATTIALQLHGSSNDLVVNGHTYTAHPDGPAVTSPPGSVTQGVFTTNGHTITAARAGNSYILVDGTKTTTLPAGATATFDGQTIVAPSGNGPLAVNGHNVLLTAAAGTGAILTIGDSVITAVNAGRSVILKNGSSTITVADGSQVTFEGHTISIGPNGENVNVQYPLTGAASPTTTGTGDYIATGIGANPSASASVQLADPNSAPSAGLPAVLGSGVFALWSLLAVL